MSKLLPRLLLVGMVLVVGTASPAQEEGKKHATDEMDRKIRLNINRLINTGADMYNSGDREGCYQLYRGALIGLSSLLDHHPTLAKAVPDGLAKARKLPTPGERAFALRDVLDEMLKVLPAPAAVAKTLYERLGGEPAVTAVIDDFVGRAAGDPKVNFTRKGTPAEWKATPDNVALLKKRLVQFVSMATGGPKNYEGKSMKAAHKGMQITDAEFDAIAADLVATLDKFKVPAREKNELLKIVGSTRKDIVEPAEKTLYERLGGEGAVTSVIDDFVGRAAGDPKVNFTRKGTPAEWKATPDNVALLKKRLVQFVSMATGGPKTYEGKSMKAAHKGMQITDAEFDAIAADLVATLDKFKVPAKEKDELLKIVGSTRKDIVEPAEKTLYERLGGEPAVTAVIDDFVGRAAGDKKVNFTRKGTAAEWKATPQNVALLKKRLVQFVSMATGGPKTYEGKNMKAAHKGMQITDAEFDAIAADLVATLEKFKVPTKEKDELLKIVGSTRKDIVEKKGDEEEKK